MDQIRNFQSQMKPSDSVIIEKIQLFMTLVHIIIDKDTLYFLIFILKFDML